MVAEASRFSSFDFMSTIDEIVARAGAARRIGQGQTCESGYAGPCANSEAEWGTLVIWVKWAKGEKGERHEGSVSMATFRPEFHHPVCATVFVLEEEDPTLTPV